MLPLNPYLRAFFSSKLIAQCSDPADHVLLVPTTDFIFNSRDRETDQLYSEYVCTEEFLASHVLQISSDAPFLNHNPGGANLREGKAKPRQYTTLNGRTVVIKDASIYSNKGFKSLHTSQLLFDELIYNTGMDQSPWLIYYISQPLLGSPELLPAFNTMQPIIAMTPAESPMVEHSAAKPPKKQEIKKFQDVLTSFPNISRQLHSGFEQLFQQFYRDAKMSEEKDVVEEARDASTSSTPPPEKQMVTRRRRSSSLTPVTSVESVAEAMLSRSERHARRALENLVGSTIDLFQRMDQAHLTLLANSTDLSGLAIEYMLERYVTEQVHEKVLFPTICDAHKRDDDDTYQAMKQMFDVDISQIGIDYEHQHRGRTKLMQRVEKAVTIFKKMGSAQSPQEMGEILIETQSCITTGSSESTQNTTVHNAEKSENLDADMLVPLLLLVVIRSQIRNLQSRLVYMRMFSFFSDVESGELGYVISTFEAVLQYISTDAPSLIKISRTNRSLWKSVKDGDFASVRSFLDEDGDKFSMDNEPQEHSDGEEIASPHHASSLPNGDSRTAFGSGSNAVESSLSHVFPFMALQDKPKADIKVKKRVSMDVSSMSSRNSITSHTSASSTLRSMRSSMLNDLTAAHLSHSRDSTGASILMMAIEAGQLKLLTLLLQREDLFTVEDILQDRNYEGTTLFSAAVQSQDRSMADCVLDFFLSNVDDMNTLVDYFRYQDSKGRCVAHYLFHVPELIGRLGSLLPWRLKDHNGQTPLFALCRSYDHETYAEMIDTSMKAAAKHQGDGLVLQLDDHVDSKQNTLLHIAHEPQLVQKLLHQCNADPNAFNEKRFTPIMLAAKFARIDCVRVLYGDERTDVQARDLRGLTAVELAKDDEVRNRIDDISLLTDVPMDGQRRTMIARSLFVEDGSIRMVVKSGIRNTESTITVTTCRRSQMDFLNLVKCLLLEQPASWLPSISDFRSPFQIPSRPSRQTLRDIQLRLELFLQSLLEHPTFANHETLWEFILVPDIDMSMLIDRAYRKVANRADHLREEYEPLTSEFPSVSLFVNYASEQVSSVHRASAQVFRSICNIRNISNDLALASALSARQLCAISSLLPAAHANAYTRYVSHLSQNEHSPIIQFQYALHSARTNCQALFHIFDRPRSLIAALNTTQESLARYTAAAAKPARWGISILDDARTRLQVENENKAAAARAELDMLGRELRYTQQTVAVELAAWQENRGQVLKASLKALARRMVTVERERLNGMRRMLRALDHAKLEKK